MGEFFHAEELKRWQDEPRHIRFLTRMAYEGAPEQAGSIARSLGIYRDFIFHMLRVHRTLTYPYRSKHGRSR